MLNKSIPEFPKKRYMLHTKTGRIDIYTVHEDGIKSGFDIFYAQVEGQHLKTGFESRDEALAYFNKKCLKK